MYLFASVADLRGSCSTNLHASRTKQTITDSKSAAVFTNYLAVHCWFGVDGVDSFVQLRIKCLAHCRNGLNSRTSEGGLKTVCDPASAFEDSITGSIFRCRLDRTIQVIQHWQQGCDKPCFLRGGAFIG